MELLSQLDIQSPDHVSVITREGRVTISVTKDGGSVTLGFPVNSQVFNTAPKLPLQQTTTKLMAVRSTKVKSRVDNFFNAKLNESQVKEIKQMLADKDLMKNFSSKHKAHQAIGKAYEVSHHTIVNISKGLAWKHVTAD